MLHVLSCPGAIFLLHDYHYLKEGREQNTGRVEEEENTGLVKKVSTGFLDKANFFTGNRVLTRGSLKTAHYSLQAPW